MEKNFNIVIDGVEKALANRGFEKQLSDSQTEVLFVNNEIAYSVSYDSTNKQFHLKSCSVADNTPDKNWKNMSSWLFDPETSTKRDAEYIADDFSNSLKGPKKPVVQAPKKKKDNDNKVDILFLMNRFANIFPDLKDEIKYERENYSTFRMVTFTEDKLLPRINMFLLQNSSLKQLKKFCNILSDTYASGDLDVKSVITILILNNIKDEKQAENVRKGISDELQRAWNEAIKIKDKNIKPEKPKKSKKNFMADTLLNK